MARQLTQDQAHKLFRPFDYHDWDQWLDGSVWLLVKGEDYRCATPSLISYVYRSARERGLRVRVTTKNLPKHVTEGIVIEALVPGRQLSLFA